MDVLLSLSVLLLGLDLEGLEALFETADAGFGFSLVKIALGVTVDQAGNALAQFGDLLVDQRRVGLARSRLNRGQPALIFVSQPRRLGQQLPNGAPDGLLQPVGT